MPQNEVRFTAGDPPEAPGPPQPARRARGPVPDPDVPEEVADVAPVDEEDLLLAGEPPVAPEPVQGDAREGERVLVHFTEDGLTANGRTWYRGQELEFIVGEPEYEDTKDRYGKSWLEMDDAAQMKRFGRVMFRPGPWPGESYDSESAAEAERQRGRKPPRLPSVAAPRR